MGSSSDFPPLSQEQFDFLSQIAHGPVVITIDAASDSGTSRAHDERCRWVIKWSALGLVELARPPEPNASGGDPAWRDVAAKGVTEAGRRVLRAYSTPAADETKVIEDRISFDILDLRGDLVADYLDLTRLAELDGGGLSPTIAVDLERQLHRAIHARARRAGQLWFEELSGRGLLWTPALEALVRQSITRVVSRGLNDIATVEALLRDLAASGVAHAPSRTREDVVADAVELATKEWRERTQLAAGVDPAGTARSLDERDVRSPGAPIVAARSPSMAANNGLRTIIPQNLVLLRQLLAELRRMIEADESVPDRRVVTKQLEAVQAEAGAATPSLGRLRGLFAELTSSIETLAAWPAAPELIAQLEGLLTP